MNSYSTAAAQVILPHVIAPWHEMELQQTTLENVVGNTQLFVAFGGLPRRNAQVAYGGITEHRTHLDLQRARASGVRFVNISPVAGDVDAALDALWLAPKPGTDVALMLGLAFVLETEGLADHVFLQSHSVGYGRVKDYVLGSSDGEPKTPAWAAAKCDVEAEAIVALAREMAARRTFLTAAWSLQRGDHGEQPYWMLATLAAMLGQIGLPGGGFGFGYSAEGFVGSDYKRFNWATLPKGRNPTGVAIPVARIADMLLNPGSEVQYDGRSITYPDTKLIYWAGGNPFHHHQDLNRLVEGWRRPDTVIVNEPWWTPVAQWADIVFPATTSLERTDICASSHDPYAHLMQQAILPQHEARSDHEIFAGLADRLGFAGAFTENKTERQWLEDMWQRSSALAAQQGFELPSFEQWERAGVYRLPDEPRTKDWMADFRSDPKAFPLATPSGKLELYSQTIASYGYEDCPGQATWLEPQEWQEVDSVLYPLYLLSPQPKRRLHSQFDQSAYSQRGKILGKEVLTMHPTSAQTRGIAAGDLVRVFNQRGACLAGVALDTNLRVDTVVLPVGSWFKPCPKTGLELNGNPNVLTRDKGTSQLAQGPSAHTCLVQVEKFTRPQHDSESSA
jgi:biotin/methionine sulfoxide reductase